MTGVGLMHSELPPHEVVDGPTQHHERKALKHEANKFVPGFAPLVPGAAFAPPKSF